MPQPRPSDTLCSLTPQTGSSVFLETVSEILSSWQNGLLPHKYPDEPPLLVTAFTRLLKELPEHPWYSVENHLLTFLQHTLLTTLVDHLTTETPHIDEELLHAIDSLLNLHKATRAVLAEAVFVTLRLHDTGELSSVILRDSTLPELVSTHLGKLLPRIRAALTADIRSTPSMIVIPATQILHSVITTCTQTALTKQVTPTRDMLHPLLEHPSVETRVPGLQLLTLLSERCGVTSTSVPFIKTSLLWNDPDTAVIAIPLLVRNFPYLDVETRHECEKRVMECVIALSSAFQDRQPCVASALAAIELLPYMDDIVVRHGQRYLCAMGAFLGRIGVMVAGKTLEKGCVTRVCEAVVKGVQRCWIACDGFRVEVFKGCLICFMETDDTIVSEGVKDVILTLARCHPGRMRRLKRDVRASVEGLAGMGRVVTFLEKVEGEFVDVGEMTKVETGRLVGRFFPELKEFNIN